MSITALTLNTGGDIACSGSRDTSITLTDLNILHVLVSRSTSRNVVTGAVWPKGSATFVQTAEDKSIKIWDTRTLTLEQQMPVQDHIHTTLDVCGDMVVSGSRGTEGNGAVVALWDMRMLKLVMEYNGQSETISRVRFLNVDDSSHIVSSSFDSTIRIWNTSGSYTELELSGVGQITDFDIFPNKRICVSTFKDGIYCLQYNQHLEMKTVSLF